MSAPESKPSDAYVIDPQFKEWATQRQAEYVDAINEHGSIRAAARALKVSKGTIDDSVRLLRKKAALRGYSPPHDLTKSVPEPMILKGASTLYGANGAVKLQWVKSQLDNDKREELIRAAFQAAADELPRLDPIEPPLFVADDLCNLFTMTDCHVGMLAWRKEGGEDWDLRVAERTLMGCFERMVTTAPKAKVAVVAQLGDFLHAAGILPVTPTSGHVLDADGRFSKVVAVAIRILRRLVDIALMRHEIVHVLMAEGNHDITSSIWLRQMFAALYENEPRVLVVDSELPYYVVRHGKTMLAFHHGHLKKNEQLPILFAAQFPEVWGASTKRYVHTGHRHHVEEKEHPGMTVVQHPTLAARDAYAARGGWIAERQVSAITYHAEFGQVGRTTVVPEMLEAA